MGQDDGAFGTAVEARLRDLVRDRLASPSWRWVAGLRRWAGRPAASPEIARPADALAVLDGLDRSVAWDLAAPLRLAARLAGRAAGAASPAVGAAEPPPTTVDGMVLSADPIVLYLKRRRSPLAAVAALSARLGARPAAFLVHAPGGWLPDAALRARVEHDAQRARHPGHRIVFLCNEPRELELLTGAGVPVRLMNNNMFADERAWRVRPEVARRFDAVYNARYSPVKRHGLARTVRSLALIAYPFGPRAAEHAEAVRRALPHATFCNGVPPAHRWLSHDEAAEIHNASRVGLCLSRVEGSMRASVEYLLCGLPVVTTPSLGGRDRYFDPEFCETVPADPAAVAAAVRRLAARRIDPDHIRARTLARLRQDREAFFDLVQDFYDLLGARRRFRDDWPALHRNNLTEWNRPLDVFLAEAGISP